MGLPHAALGGVLPRAALDVDHAVELVRPMTEDVRVRGGVAVREYTNRFDGVDLERTRVPDTSRWRSRPLAHVSDIELDLTSGRFER